MSTLIKRLSQNGQEFVPITLQEAVVVNTTNLTSLNGLGITTLDKVLQAVLGLISENVTEESLNQIVNNINLQLSNKLNKLTAGTGIEITNEGVINCTVSLDLYEIVSTLPTPGVNNLNKIYLLHNGVDFEEYICINVGNSYNWEQIGTLKTDIDVSNFVTKDQFMQSMSSIQETLDSKIDAVNVTFANGSTVAVSYDIPNNLYQY